MLPEVPTLKVRNTFNYMSLKRLWVLYDSVVRIQFKDTIGILILHVYKNEAFK